MNLDEMKKAVGHAALRFIKPNTVVGVGTGSTVAFFIEALGTIKNQIDGAVASSVQSAEHIRLLGINLYDLNKINQLDVYVDSADEITQHNIMIKGGGAALTGEKIVAAVAKTFICIIDSSKQVNKLGFFPLAVEVIPTARSYVARELVKLGGFPKHRQGIVTDNGNIILDVHNLDISEPITMEQTINNISGVVTNGIFAARRADHVIVGTPDGVIQR